LVLGEQLTKTSSAKAFPRSHGRTKGCREVTPGERCIIGTFSDQTTGSCSMLKVIAERLNGWRPRKAGGIGIAASRTTEGKRSMGNLAKIDQVLRRASDAGEIPGGGRDGWDQPRSDLSGRLRQT
jgi:hypothetical protein